MKRQKYHIKSLSIKTSDTTYVYIALIVQKLAFKNNINQLEYSPYWMEILNKPLVL